MTTNLMLIDRESHRNDLPPATGATRDLVLAVAVFADGISMRPPFFGGACR